MAERKAAAAPQYGANDQAEFGQRMDELVQQLSPPAEPGEYLAYTDGACLRNPSGPGGWGAVVSHVGEPPQEWELWGHLSSTSNNRAEVLAVLAALEWLPRGSAITVRSDSEYTLKVLKGEYKAKANTDIWADVRSTVALKGLKVKAEWVPGHAGVEGNERADRLSVLGATNGDEARVRALRSTAPPPRSAAGRALRAPEPPPADLDGVKPRGPWEEQFFASITKQLRQGRPLSEKQQAIVNRMRVRGE